MFLKREEPEAGGEEGGPGSHSSARDQLLRWTMECVELYSDGEETFADIRGRRSPRDPGDPLAGVQEVAPGALLGADG